MPMAIDYPEVTDHAQDRIDLTFCLQRHICIDSVCRKIVDGVQSCRYKFPRERSPKTFIRVIRDKLKNNLYGPYRIEIVSKRHNDDRIVNHNIEQLIHWRANCDFSLLTDAIRVMKYVSKYATKPETRSNVFKNAFHAVFSNAADSVDTRFALRQVMLKVLSERDITVQEAFHIIMSSKCYTFN